MVATFPQSFVCPFGVGLVMEFFPIKELTDLFILYNRNLASAVFKVEQFCNPQFVEIFSRKPLLLNNLIFEHFCYAQKPDFSKNWFEVSIIYMFVDRSDVPIAFLPGTLRRTRPNVRYDLKSATERYPLPTLHQLDGVP